MTSNKEPANNIAGFFMPYKNPVSQTFNVPSIESSNVLPNAAPVGIFTNAMPLPCLLSQNDVIKISIRVTSYYCKRGEKNLFSPRNFTGG